MLSVGTQWITISRTRIMTQTGEVLLFLVAFGLLPSLSLEIDCSVWVNGLFVTLPFCLQYNQMCKYIKLDRYQFADDNGVTCPNLSIAEFVLCFGQHLL